MTAKDAKKLTGACNRFQAASALYAQLETRCWKDEQGRAYRTSGMKGLQFLSLTHMQTKVDAVDGGVSVAVRILRVPLEDALAASNGLVPTSAHIVF